MTDLDKAFQDAKAKQFNDGLKKLEEETGMKCIAVLKPSPTALRAELVIVPKAQLKATE